MKGYRFFNTVMAVITLICVMVVPTAAAFQDVPETHWSANYVTYAESYGIINGIGDGKFAPNATLTEAQCCQIIYNGLVTQSTQSTGVRWYKEAVDWVQSRWLNVTIVPDRAATRIFVAELVTEFGPPIEMRVTERVNSNYLPFTDCNKLSSYELYAVKNCWQNGIIDGYQDGTFRPFAKLTRAEGAKMFAIWHHQEYYGTPDPSKPMSLQQKAQAEAESMGRYAQSLGWFVEASPWSFNHDDGTYWYRLKVTNRNKVEEFLVGGSITDGNIWWYYEDIDGFDFLGSRDGVRMLLEHLR